MAFPPNIDLSSLDGSSGFRIDGEAADFWSGDSVASAGDVNGDGFDDVIVGAPHPNGSSTGASYVVFGRASGFAPAVDLSSLDGSNGFKLSGEAVGDWNGSSVASAGDVNADGFADLVVGSPSADPNGSFSGAAYVVFGKASGLPGNLDLSSLDGSNGFKLEGESTLDSAGISVGSAGDINGDGFADVIVGSQGADPTNDNSYLGASYVVFGKATGFAADLDLANLDGSNGFRLIGAQPGSSGGSPVASAGDLNGDGFDDLVVSTQIFFDPDGSSGGAYSAMTYVVFGRASGFGADFDLASLDGSNGFHYVAWAGDVSVASAGDVNGDGFADLVVGSSIGVADGQYIGGTSVVFGSASGFAADGPGILDGSNGFKVVGAAPYDAAGCAVSGAGDINGDGFDDLIIGAFGADPHGIYSGAAYVVFGKAAGFAASLNLADLDGVNGFKLSGVAPYDQVGISVSSAGDVNGDGFDDLIMGSISADPNGSASGSSYVVFGGAFGATVTTNGTAAGEMLIGGAGNDTLAGGGGPDVFHAGAGDDWLKVERYDLSRGGWRGRYRQAFAHGQRPVPRSHGSLGRGAHPGNRADRPQGHRRQYAGRRPAGRSRRNRRRRWRQARAHRRWQCRRHGRLCRRAMDKDWLGKQCSGHVLPIRVRRRRIADQEGTQRHADHDNPAVDLDGLNGFELRGIGGGDRSGRSVASAGDVNGDGFEDLLIGAPYSGPHGYEFGGKLRRVRQGGGLHQHFRPVHPQPG